MKISKMRHAAFGALLVLASSAQASVHGDGSVGDWILLLLIMAAPWLLLCLVAVVLFVLLVRSLVRGRSTLAREAEQERD